MSDTLSPLPHNIPQVPRDSPSRSPHQHILRPRRSFQRLPFSPKSSIINASVIVPDKLRSPLKLADGKSSTDASTGGVTGTVKPLHASNKSKDKVGSVLFPSGSEEEARASSNTITSSRNGGARPVREAGLKKFATSLSGAFNGKGKSGKEQRFDLSELNHDLAAIASNPVSSSGSKPHPSTSKIPHLSTSQIPSPTSDDLITPTASHFPTISALPRHLDLRVGLELPPAETRRRKSEEMEDKDRSQYSAAVPIVRRDAHGRPHSLAHAHTLRSSRALSSHHATTNSPRLHHSTSSQSLGPNMQARNAVASGSTFSPFADNRAEPPSKKISLEGLGSPGERCVSDESEEGLEADDSDSNVFGGRSAMGPPSPSTWNGKKAPRSKVLARSSNPLFHSFSPITASSSHPGWIGEGFDSPSQGNGKRVQSGIPMAESMRGRSRKGSASASGLDTLLESGPAPDYFSISTRGAFTEDAVMTPPRRRSNEGFNLFGSNPGSRRGSVVGDNQEEEILKDEYDPDDDSESREDEGGDIDFNDSQPFSTPVPLGGRRIAHLTIDTGHALPFPPPQGISSFPSRRAASMDSLFLASLSQSSNSPFGRPGTVSTPNGRREIVNPSVHNLRDQPGRKRNANGALLVGTLGGSRLAATSPVVARRSSPAPWNARDNSDAMDEEDEDDSEEGGNADAMDEDVTSNSWGDGRISPHLPGLTDGTTSASSSLSTSLSSHAEGDPVRGSTDVSLATTSNSIGSIKSINDEVPSAEPGFLTPKHYRDVKPLQAAFMSAGLVSKMQGGSRRPSGGLGSGLAAPSFTLAHHLHELELLNPNSPKSTLTNASLAHLPIANPLLANMRASVMPDTPVKKAVFTHAATSSPAPIADPILSTSQRLARADKESPDSLSPLRTLEGDASSSASPCSGRSMGSDAGSRDASPTVNASRSSTRAAGSWKKPGLYLRRSSGQISNEGTHLSVHNAKYGSGSSSGSTSFLEGEPMTPTRSSGTKWMERKFCNSIDIPRILLTYRSSQYLNLQKLLSFLQSLPQVPSSPLIISCPPLLHLSLRLLHLPPRMVLVDNHSPSLISNDGNLVKDRDRILKVDIKLNCAILDQRSPQLMSKQCRTRVGSRRISLC